MVVSTDNHLFTWGLSPQAIRLQTQAKKRARANQREEAAAKVERVTTVAADDTPPPGVDDEPDPDLDDVFEEKANVEDQEKSVKKIDEEAEVAVPEIKVDLVEDKPLPVEEEESKEALLEESTDHHYPTVIDVEFEKSIVKLASGLYHYALLTVDGNVYTWGKNLEKQLGREGPRNEIPFPSRLENISHATALECGADFTVIALQDGSVKACGNNNNGQCGREIAPSSRAGIAGKLVRLRISKRLVRIPDSTQCIDVPQDVKLPTTEPHAAHHIVRTLKNLPQYSDGCVIPSPLSKLPAFVQNSGHTTIDSNLNEFCRDDSVPDLIQNLDANENRKIDLCSPSSEAQLISESSVSQFALNRCSIDNILTSDYIHYCLYIFHGLYDQSAIINFSSKTLNFKEYKLRILMLNFEYIEAFKLCIGECLEAPKCIKLLEYFTKDPAIVPAFEEDMKFFIYETFKHFIRHQMNIGLLEDYFLSDLDYYVIQLSYVLYFNNNNNTSLEKSVFQKFKHLFINFDQRTTLENTDVIFKMISTKFNVAVCQKLIDLSDNLSMD